MKNKIADIYDSSVHGIDKKHIPEFRFPEFANTGEWEEKKVGEVCVNEDNKRRPVSRFDRISGQYPYYGANGIQDFVNDFIFNGERLLVGEDGSVLTKDNTPVMTWAIGKFWVNNHAHVLAQKKDIPLKYIYYSLSTKDISGLVTGVPPKLNQENLNNIRILLPSTFAEQQKIAECLSSIDEQILATQQKWDSLKEYKRGLMQKLFPANGKTTPDFRFPEFANAGEWEEKQLNTIGETLGGLSGKNAEDFGQGEPYVTYKQVFAGARIKFNDCQLVQILPNESQNKLQYGDVLITMSSETPNEIGYSAVVTSKPLKSYYLNSFCFIFRYKNSIAIDPLFSIYLFQSNLYRINVIRIAQGITRYNISPSKFLDIKLSFPSFAEQQKIAQCLSSVDEQILATQQKWDFLKEHKRGLMQRLFPNNSIDFKN